jgi:hypothetical protein
MPTPKVRVFQLLLENVTCLSTGGYDHTLLSVRIRFRVELGRAIAQAVSRWVPTAAARVCVRAACGICGGQSGIGAGFLRVLRFPLPIIPPISPSSQSSGAVTIGLLVAAVPSRPNWTPPPNIPIKKN